MKINDTIAAVSTPRGKGGVALIRVSGEEALAVCERVFAPKSKKRLSELEDRRAVYGDIVASDMKIDDGMAVVFRAPHSFTGEDTVEITCHGGLLVTEEVLSAILAAGARAAEAGEFTRRAFVSGKLTLSEAEGLGALLEAKTHAALLLSRAGLDGRLSGEIAEIYEALLGVASALYAAIDYPEEDLAEITREEAAEKLLVWQARVRELAATYRSGHAVAEGIRTVICGKPNVGKSSLFNALVGKEAAIVTDLAGTTRDVLEQTAVLGEVSLRLFDTAGLHESMDRVEQIGMARAREALLGAELVLAVFDGSSPFDDRDRALCELVQEAGGVKLALLNKCDKSAEEPPKLDGFSAVLSLSVKTGEGMEKLKETVRDLFFDGALSLSEDAVVSNARQHAALVRCDEALDGALAAFREGLSEDICCSVLEEAMSALGEIDGRAVSEDIVGEIFSKFCVGK